MFFNLGIAWGKLGLPDLTKAPGPNVCAGSTRGLSGLLEGGGRCGVRGGGGVGAGR